MLSTTLLIASYPLSQRWKFKLLPSYTIRYRQNKSRISQANGTLRYWAIKKLRRTVLARALARATICARLNHNTSVQNFTVRTAMEEAYTLSHVELAPRPGLIKDVRNQRLLSIYETPPFAARRQICAWGWFPHGLGGGISEAVGGGSSRSIQQVSTRFTKTGFGKFLMLHVRLHVSSPCSCLRPLTNRQMLAVENVHRYPQRQAAVD